MLIIPSGVTDLHQPAQYLLNDGGVERVDDILSFSFAQYQAGLSQQVEVMGNAGFGHVEVFGNFPGGQIPLSQQTENLPTRGISQCFKRVVQENHLYDI